MVTLRGEGVAPLTERDAELACIERNLSRASRGRGGVTVVSGPAGIGKTALLAAAREMAVSSDMRVLRARGAELEGEFGFGVVRQLFEPLLATAAPEERADWLEGPAGLAARLLNLRGVGAAGDGIPEYADPSFAVLHGLYWLCANLAAAQPLCLVVDDAHWADAASLRFAAFLQPRLEELPVALVMATRPAEGAARSALIAGIVTDPGTELIELDPLSVDGVDRLLHDQLRVEPDPAFVAACHRATGGVPFLVGLLVRAADEEGMSPTDGAVPRIEGLGARWAARWILLRIGRLPPDAEELARALAVLESADVASAAAVSRLPPEATAAAADLLAQAGIIRPTRPLTFVHPVVRRGIYEEIGPAERARAHRDAARALADGGAAPERVVEHLLAAEPAGDGWVTGRLRAAAKNTLASGAPEPAMTYLRRALAEPPDEHERSSILLELGIAALSSGDENAFETLQQAVDAARSDAEYVSAALMLTNAHGIAQQFEEALAVLERILEKVGGDDGEVDRTLETTAMGVAMLDVKTAGGNAHRIRAARERVERGGSVGRDALALATLIAAQSNEPADVVTALGERAWAAGGGDFPQPGDLPWFEQMTASLVWCEREDLALPMLDTAVARARASADTRGFASSLCYRAQLALQRGDLRTAEVEARSALESPGIRPSPLYRTLLTAVLVETLTECGELDEADSRLALVASEPERRHSVAAWLRLSRARLRIAQRRVEEGLADAQAAGAVAVDLGFDAPGWLPWHPVAARAALLLGDMDTARRHARAGLQLARTFGAPRTLGVALNAAGLVAGGAEGERLLRESLAAHERRSARLETARSLTDLGAMLRRSRRRVEARKLLRDGLDAATRIGAGPLAERAETELRATGARPRRVVLTGLESLTASERRVVELAAEGLGNREIAQTLFVTARTVEGHLTAAFRKLDVSSRRELPAVLAAPAHSI